MTPDAALVRVRATCLALPDVTERPSHGMPAWFVGKRQFAVLSNQHHHDGRLAVVCAAPEGMQAMLVDNEPDGYYVPPYVGHLGWVGVRLDREVVWSQVARIIESAHATRARAGVAAAPSRAASSSTLARRSTEPRRPSPALPTGRRSRPATDPRRPSEAVPARPSKRKRATAGPRR